MKYARIAQAFVRFVPRASVVAGSLGLAALLSVSVIAQDKKPDTNAPAPAKSADAGRDWSNYVIHQSFDLGGHINNLDGSEAMYSTLVNVHSGPRILNHSLEMHAAPDSKHELFDTLFENSAGYGGDPNAYSSLRASKGKIYDFVGSFRRDRQYFDYNLWGNPLVPGGAKAPVSNGYTFGQVMQSPHYFNTVRRNTDVLLTFFPVSKVSFRAGYNLNVMEGPSQSSIHIGADALLYQNWRNSTQTFLAGLDWKPAARTTLTYEEHVTSYKGDTWWALTGLNMQLPGGTPTTIGFDIVANPAATSANTGCGAHPAVLDNTTTPPTANPCVNDYVRYLRTQPTRTLFPTEEFRFQSASLKNLQMNGRILYTGATMKLDNYNEQFNGLESRVLIRVAKVPPGPAPAAFCTKSTAGGVTTYNLCHSGMTVTGSAKGQRVDFGADYGLVWQIAPSFAVNEQFDFQNWRQPAEAAFLTTDVYSASALGNASVTVGPEESASNSFLGQKLTTNTIMGEWEHETLQVGIGYRLRSRELTIRRDTPTEEVVTPDQLNYTKKINESAAILDLVVRPAKTLRINGGVELGWADAAYVQTNPRQFQHYTARFTYHPRAWATVSGTFNDRERRNMTTLVDYKAHQRAGAGTVSLAPNEKFSFDATYGYIDVFSTGVDCFDDTVPPSGVTPLPVGVPCGNAVNTTSSTAAFYGNSYYDAPTQYGSAALVWTPVKAFRGGFGYRVNDVQGTTQLLHPLAVPGTLRSRYQTPFVNLAYSFTSAWTVKADYNYYGYGEDGPVGPTAPRNFHSNMYTLGMHYQF